MKQGTGNNMVAGRKVEPNARAISVDKVANMGNQIIRTKPPTKDLVKGRGFNAPAPVATTHHRSGSQGKHGGK